MKVLNALLTPFANFGNAIAKIIGQSDKPKINSDEPKKFGTFQGVFTPTVLTILGVIMYLRQPWVVGNAGIFGAILIILLAVSITLCTTLSMASMTTNIRIGRGGAFSIISQSLGLEVGGSIGLPLYFSQAFAVAMYVFGFREGVEWLIMKVAMDPQAVLTPQLSWIINFGTFIVVFAIVQISTDFAFKIQYVLMALVGASIISIFGGLLNIDFAARWDDIYWVGDFDAGNNSFWVVFAVFFPAVTGIMAGANMSGELKNPRKAIPNGTLSGVLLTTVIYIALIFVAALLADRNDLITDYNIFMERSYWWPIVLVGLLGATLSSALSSFVGAPRILAALGEFNILPKSEFFAKTNKKGEPQNAVLFTGLIVFISLLAGDLNAIAPLITMFFMITYAMINVVVLIEQSLGLPSFRPTLKVPIIVPLLGTIGCVFVMFIINSTFALISMGLVIAFYGYLMRRELKGQQGDSRSGLFTALAEWATKKSNELSPKKEARAWQPELLVPVEFAKELRGAYRILYALTYPKGSIKVLGMKTTENDERLENYLPSLMDTFNDAKIASSYSFIDGNDYGKIVGVSMQALRTAFFMPNTVFLKLDERAHHKAEDYQSIVKQAQAHDWGVIFFAPYETGLGIEKTINVWLNYIPDNWEKELDLDNNDLAILTGLIIENNWKGKLNIIKVIDDENLTDEFVMEHVNYIKELARIPKATTVQLVRKSDTMWEDAARADINIMGISELDLDVDYLRTIPDKLSSSCLFTLDSGEENALV
jgi:amino acid transporter